MYNAFSRCIGKWDEYCIFCHVNFSSALWYAWQNTIRSERKHIVYRWSYIHSHPCACTKKKWRSLFKIPDRINVLINHPLVLSPALSFSENASLEKRACSFIRGTVRKSDGTKNGPVLKIISPERRDNGRGNRRIISRGVIFLRLALNMKRKVYIGWIIIITSLRFSLFPIRIARPAGLLSKSIMGCRMRSGLCPR